MTELHRARLFQRLVKFNAATGCRLSQGDFAELMDYCNALVAALEAAEKEPDPDLILERIDAARLDRVESELAKLRLQYDAHHHDG